MKKIHSYVKTLIMFLFAVIIVSISTNLSVLAVEEEPSEKVDEVKEEDSANKTSKIPMAIIEIENYSVEDGMLAAGNDISIMLKIHNLSNSVAAKSVMLTVYSDSGMAYPSYGNDNQFFIGDISANTTVEVSVPLSISSAFSGDAIDLRCQFDYASSGIRASNSSTMVITTSGGNDITVSSLDVSPHSIVNGKSLVNISYSNKSNSNITDAKLLIEGNVSEENKTIELETVYAGKSYNKDYDITFTQAGNQEIHIKLEYSDAMGEKVEVNLGTYSVSVDNEQISEQLDGTYLFILKWGGRAFSCVIALIAFSVIVRYIKKR